jgi:hypothetical protein
MRKAPQARKLDRRPTRRAARTKKRASVLLLENLELRLVPTVVFDPVFPKESITSNTPYTVLNSPAIELIFWGSGWASTAGTAQAQKWAGDVQTILGTPYLTGLTEYGSDGRALFGSSWIDSSDPPSGYQSGGPGNDANGQSSQIDMQNEIQKVIDNPSTPIPPPINNATITQAPIYVVIPDPAHSNTNGGYNVPGQYSGTYGSGRINMISVGTSGNIEDFFTTTFSPRTDRAHDGSRRRRDRRRRNLPDRSVIPKLLE